MKQITQLLTLFVFASLIIFISCKKKTTSDPDPLDIQAEKLMSATWGPEGTTSITKDENENGNWESFTISFNYNNETDIGQYTVTGVPTNENFEEVFGAGGSQAWAFDGTNTGILVRQDDQVRMQVSVTEGSSLTLSFNIDGSSSGRIDGIDGEWRFELTAQ